MKYALAFAIVLSSSVAAFAPASADEDPVVAAQAETLRRANDKFDAKDYEGAIALYENIVRTLGTRRAMKVLFNLGLAYEASGDVSSAITSYDSFLEACGRDPFPTADLVKRRDEATVRRAALTKTHGAIQVTTARPGAAAFFRLADGPIHPAGTKIWVAPGDHAVELDSGTPQQRTVHVLVEAEKTANLVIEPPAPTAGPAVEPAGPRAPVPLPLRPTRAETSTHDFPTWPLVIGASAIIVAAAVPLGFGLEAASKRRAAEDAGTGASGYAGLRDDFNAARTRYYVSFSVPAVVAAAAAVWVIVSASSSRSSASHR